MSLSLPRTAFESILKHLVEVEDEKEYVLNVCFPLYKDREGMRTLIDDYILRMNDLISRIKVYERAKNDATGLNGLPESITLPFVMVGSEVSVAILDQNEQVDYRVQHPFKTNGSRDEISYVSPLGAALLLKEPGQEVIIKIPAGKLRYRVESIRLITESDGRPL